MVDQYFWQKYKTFWVSSSQLHICGHTNQGLGRKTIQFAQNYDENDANTTQNNPSVFVLKSKLPSKDAHQMSQNDLWTYYAKELLNVYCEDQNVKYLAITNVTK